MLKSDVNIVKKGLKKIHFKNVTTFYVKDRQVLREKKLNLTELGKEFCTELVTSMKKSLTGGNSKLFAMDLKSKAVQDKLIELKEDGDISAFIEENKEFLKYDEDVIVNVIQYSIQQVNKKESDDAMEDEDNAKDDERFVEHDMFMVIVHKAEELKEIGFSLQDTDFVEISTKNINNIDVIIDFKKPFEAFMFPIIEDAQLNVNKVLYFTSKANKINGNITTKMLGCDFILPPKEEKLLFNAIITEMFGEIPTKTLYNVYRQIHDRLDEENEVINTTELQSILDGQKFVTPLEISKYIEDLYGVDYYEFKILNIAPDFSKKSVNIKNNDVNIKVSPEALSSLKSMTDEEGNTFVMIKIEEDLIVDELNVKPTK